MSKIDPISIDQITQACLKTLEKIQTVKLKTNILGLNIELNHFEQMYMTVRKIFDTDNERIIKTIKQLSQIMSLSIRLTYIQMMRACNNIVEEIRKKNNMLDFEKQMKLIDYDRYDRQKQHIEQRFISYRKMGRDERERVSKDWLNQINGTFEEIKKQQAERYCYFTDCKNDDFMDSRRVSLEGDFWDALNKFKIGMSSYSEELSRTNSNTMTACVTSIINFNEGISQGRINLVEMVKNEKMGLNQYQKLKQKDGSMVEKSSGILRNKFKNQNKAVTFSKHIYVQNDVCSVQFKERAGMKKASTQSSGDIWQSLVRQGFTSIQQHILKKFNVQHRERSPRMVKPMHEVKNEVKEVDDDDEEEDPKKHQICKIKTLHEESALVQQMAEKQKQEAELKLQEMKKQQKIAQNNTQSKPIVNETNSNMTNPRNKNTTQSNFSGTISNKQPAKNRSLFATNKPKTVDNPIQNAKPVEIVQSSPPKPPETIKTDKPIPPKPEPISLSPQPFKLQPLLQPVNQSQPSQNQVAFRLQQKMKKVTLSPDKLYQIYCNIFNIVQKKAQLKPNQIQRYDIIINKDLASNEQNSIYRFIVNTIRQKFCLLDLPNDQRYVYRGPQFIFQYQFQKNQEMFQGVLKHLSKFKGVIIIGRLICYVAKQPYRGSATFYKLYCYYVQDSEEHKEYIADYVEAFKKVVHSYPHFTYQVPIKNVKEETHPDHIRFGLIKMLLYDRVGEDTKEQACLHYYEEIKSDFRVLVEKGFIYPSSRANYSEIIDDVNQQ